MNSLHDVHWSSAMDANASERDRAELLLEDYLDKLSANLLGRMADDDRVRQKDEARFHLERLIAYYESNGKAPVEAARAAVGKYGEPSKIADEVVSRAFEDGVRSKLFRSVGRANATAFAIVGVCQLLFISLLQWRVFNPSLEPYSLALDPGDMRKIFPWPLPLPQRAEDILLLYILPSIAPLMVGWIAGRLIPTRPGRAVTGATMAAVLHSFIVALSLLPRTEMFVLAVFQLLFWIPVGALFAELSLGLGVWRKARERFHA